MSVEKQNILGLTPAELKTALKPHGIQGFVADQLHNWAFKNYKISFDEMVNISKKNKEILNANFEVNPFKTYTFIPSENKAVKIIATLHDGQQIECVVLREKEYNTLCVSSQCGCPVDCKFCLTGFVGFKRNLENHEIVGQILLANHLGYNISNLVFMGMGEPMLNYKNVFSAIDILTSPDGFNISKRKITVSTSGFTHHIKQLIEDERFINLAFSVGHPNPAKRVRIMPVEKRNPIMEVVQLLHQYTQLHNRKLTLEYTLMDGVNEDDNALTELANLSRYLNAKINLINLNPHPKIPFKPVSTKVLHHARDFLHAEKVPVTIRFRKGDDIAAACGQLGESHLSGDLTD